MKNHCAYHPQSGGAVECAKNKLTLKNKLTKVKTETGLGWVKALPLVLLAMRGCPHGATNLSPFEILTGKPMKMGVSVPRPLSLEAEEMSNQMLEYCVQLTKSFQYIHAQIKETLPKPTVGQLHNLRPGDWVMIKDFLKQALSPTPMEWTVPDATHFQNSSEGQGLHNLGAHQPL